LAQLSLSANAARPKVIGWHDVSCSEVAHSALRLNSLLRLVLVTHEWPW